MPAVRLVQLAAFAHEIRAYPNEAAYEAAQTGLKVAVESFIPAGLFKVDGDSDRPPQAYALLSGRILDTARFIHHETGRDFLWARARTLGGELDVVTDPDIVQGSFVKGGVLQGYFWLTGRLAD